MDIDSEIKLDISSENDYSFISDEEKDFEKQGEAFTDPEETKGNYDYDTIVAEISKILPRIAQQIYIDTRVDELKQLALEFDYHDVVEQAKEEWLALSKNQKNIYFKHSKNESARYEFAIGGVSRRPPKSGNLLFRALCYKLIQQRYRNPGQQDMTKLVSKIWKELSEDTKKRYEQQSSELQTKYTNSLTRKQQMLEKIPKPRPAHQIYIEDQFKRVQDENPGRRGTKQRLAEEWKNLDEDAKIPYDIRAQKEKDRYTFVHEVHDSNARKNYTYKSSWVLYKEARVPQIKQEHSDDKWNAKDLSNLISAEWESFTEGEKQPWVAEAGRLKEAHQARITQSMEDSYAAKRAFLAPKKTKSAKKDKRKYTRRI